MIIGITIVFTPVEKQMQSLLIWSNCYLHCTQMPWRIFWPAHLHTNKQNAEDSWMKAVSPQALLECCLENKSTKFGPCDFKQEWSSLLGKIHKGFSGVFLTFGFILLWWKSCSKGKGGKKQNMLSQICENKICTLQKNRLPSRM